MGRENRRFIAGLLLGLGLRKILSDDGPVVKPPSGEAVSFEQEMKLEKSIALRQKTPELGRHLKDSYTASYELAGYDRRARNIQKSRSADKIRCSRCGNLIESDLSFCPFCQTNLGDESQSAKASGYWGSLEDKKVRCSSCGNLVESDLSFCPFCQTSMGTDGLESHCDDKVACRVCGNLINADAHCCPYCKTVYKPSEQSSKKDYGFYFGAGSYVQDNTPNTAGLGRCDTCNQQLIRIGDNVRCPNCDTYCGECGQLVSADARECPSCHVEFE